MELPNTIAQLRLTPPNELWNDATSQTNYFLNDLEEIKSNGWTIDWNFQYDNEAQLLLRNPQESYLLTIIGDGWIIKIEKEERI